MPAELTSDGVSDGGGKLSTQTQVCTQLPGKHLRAVQRVGQVPLKLIHQRNVPHMDIQLHISKTGTLMSDKTIKLNLSQFFNFIIYLMN